MLHISAFPTIQFNWISIKHCIAVITLPFRWKWLGCIHFSFDQLFITFYWNNRASICLLSSHITRMNVTTINHTFDIIRIITIKIIQFVAKIIEIISQDGCFYSVLPVLTLIGCMYNFSSSGQLKLAGFFFRCCWIFITNKIGKLCC